MPLYAYRCTLCGHRFEKIQSFSVEPESDCPQCGGPLERPLTAPRLQFKGAGWYVNDYASKSPAPASDSSDTPKKDAAPTSKEAPAAAATPAAPSAPTPAPSAPSSTA